MRGIQHGYFIAAAVFRRTRTNFCAKTDLLASRIYEPDNRIIIGLYTGTMRAAVTLFTINGNIFNNFTCNGTGGFNKSNSPDTGQDAARKKQHSEKRHEPESDIFHLNFHIITQSKYIGIT